MGRESSGSPGLGPGASRDPDSAGDWGGGSGYSGGGSYVANGGTFYGGSAATLGNTNTAAGWMTGIGIGDTKTKNGGNGLVVITLVVTI
jgi:hypothetical protein